MADTLTIRLDPKQRRLLDAEAVARGVGPSTLARELLEERLRDLRREHIYRESAQAGRRYGELADLAHGEDARGGIDLPIDDAMAPYEGTIGGRRP